MRICVVGCGAIGSLFAAHLAALGDVEVWVFDVSEAQVRAINDGGLRCSGVRRRDPGPIQARTDGGQIPPCELGIVATKSLHTDAALAATAGVFADAAVCSVQNGVGNEEIIARYVPRVIRGPRSWPATSRPGRGAPGCPGRHLDRPVRAAASRMDEVRQLAGLLNRGGLPTTALADARGAQWTKLIFNSATSPVAALTGLTMGQLGESDDAAS